jgi:hypothetical protein
MCKDISLHMGLDQVYWHRRAGPRLLIVVLAGAFCICFLLIFLTAYGSLAMFAGIAVSSIFMFGYLGIEYYRSKAYVKGELDGLPISDLTKTIYWLSYVGADKIPILGGYGSYWKSVRKIASIINGDFLARWKSIEDRYRISITVKLRPSPLLIQDTPQERSIARQLAQDLISWASERTEKPIYVIVSDEKFEGVQRIGTVRNQPIVEIGPKRLAEFEVPHYESKETSLLQSVPYPSKRKEQAVYATFHILFALLTGFLIFVVWRKILLVGVTDEYNLPVGLLSVVAFGLGQYMVYAGFPAMMAYFFNEGYISPSQLYTLVKRTPQQMLPSLDMVDPYLREKILFLKEISEKGRVDTSTLKEFIKEWLKLDSEQLPNDRYFNIEENDVVLTRKGEALAKLVVEKDF